MEQNDVSKLSFNDRVWDQVRLCMESKSTKSRSIWKYIVNNDGNINDLCEVCNDGGLLLKCRKPDCKKWCHALCAHERGFGLYIQEDGVIELECDFHFGDVIFCICKSKYDKTRAMVSCDSCREWFHCSCIGMKESSKLNDKDYVCASCTSLKKQGKHVSSRVLGANIAKEDQSGAQLEAEAVMNELSQLIDYVGDVVDTIRDIPLRGGVLGETRAPNSLLAVKVDKASDGVTGAMVDEIDMHDIEVALNKLAGPVYSKCIECAQNSANKTSKNVSSDHHRKSLTLASAEVEETDAPIYADVCNIDHLLLEYKGYLMSYQEEVSKWNLVWEKVIKKFVKLFSGALRNVSGSVPTSIPTTSNQLSQLAQVIEIDKLGYLFDAELYKDLCILNELLQALVGINGGGESNVQGTDGGPGSPMGSKVCESEYKEILANVFLHVKPNNFDNCTFVSKYLSWLVYAFQIVSDNVEYGGEESEVVSMVVENESDASSSRGESNSNSKLSKETFCAMLDSLNSCFLQCAPLTNQFAKNSEINASTKAVVVGFYHMLTASVGVMEKWFDAVDEFLNFTLAYDKKHGNTSANAMEISEGEKSQICDSSNALVVSSSALNDEEFEPANRPLLSNLTELIVEGNCLPISLSFIDEMKKIEQKCMLVEEASVNVLSSDMNETDTSVLKNLLTRADSIPLVIPSRSFLLFASRCMELVNRYQEITSKDSHGKVPQIHIWDVFSLATSCGSILDEYEQWYAVNTPVSSRGARHSLQKSVPKTYKLVNALVTRIRDELHVKLVAMKEDSTQFRNNTIKFLMKNPNQTMLKKMSGILQEPSNQYIVPEQLLIETLLKSYNLRGEASRLIGLIKDKEKSHSSYSPSVGKSSSANDICNDALDMGKLWDFQEEITKFVDEIEAKNLFGENDVEQKNMQAGAGRDASAACDAEFFAISDHEIVCKESEALQSTVSEYYEVIGEVSTHWAALKQAISLCNPDASTASVLDQDVDENADMCIECAVSAEEFQGLIIGAKASAMPCHSLMETCKVLEQSAISFEQKWIDVLADDIHASSYSKTKYDLTRQQEVEIFTEAFCKQLKAFACVSRQLPVKKQYRDDIDYRYALCTHCLTTSKLLKCIPSLGNSSSKTFKEVCVLNNIKDLYVKLPTVGAYTKVNHLSDVGVSDSVEVTTVRKQLDNECKALHESIVKHIKLPRVHHNDSTVIPQFLSQFLSICWRIEAAEMLQKKQYNHSKNQAQAHAVTYDACVNLLEKGESLLVSMKYVHDGSGQSQPPASIINPSFEFQGLMEAIEGAQVVVDMIDQSKDIFEDAILSSTAIFEEYVDSFSRSRSASEVSESNEFSSFPHLKRPIESGSSRDMQTKRKNSFDPRQQSSNLLNATVGSSRLEKILKCYDASETNPLGLGAEGYSVLAEAMNSWNSSQQFVELFSDLLSDMNALPISVGNESKAFVDEAFHVCDSMRKAFDVLHTMKEKFVDSDQNTSNTAAAISATPLSFKNILHLQSTMKKLLSDMTNARSKSFTLLNVLYKCLSNVVQEAQRWETLVSSLVPQRATRTKTKMELKSVKKHQLQEALSMPIATVIAINPTLVNNITISLQTADIVADEIKCLLQGVGDRTSIELSKNTRTVGDDGKTINVSGDLRGFYISQWDTILKDYSYVEEILERADLLTFELPEMGAIVWCSNVLKWLHALHNLLRLSSTGNAPGSTNIEFKSALPKYKEASKLFMNLEPGVLDLLIKWEIISTVSCEDTGKNSRIVVPSTSKALPSLMLASCVYETFTIKLNEIQEQEKEIQSILSDMEVLSTSAAFKENHEKLTALHGEMTNNSCITGCSRGTLDAMRRRLGLSVSSEVSHSHSSTPKRKAVDMDREEDWVGDGFLSHEEYDDAMDMYDDEFTVRKEKSKKVPVPKKRPRIQEHSVPSLQIKTSDVEFKKKSGIRYKCLRKDCSNECPDVSVSVYCCADCSVSNAQEHYDALMKYRQIIYRIVHDVKDRNSSSNVGLVSHLDINAMDPTVGGVPHIDIATSVQRMYGGVKKMGYDCGILQKILDRNHHAAIADAQVKQEDIGAVPPAELHGLLQLVHEEEGDKVVCKPSLVDTMRLSLPDAVHLVLKVSNQAATPRTPGTPGGSPKAAIATVDNIRATVRQNFEDSVYVSLCGTLQEFGLSSKSAVLAVDIEEDLYARYNPGGQFNKKEYRTHFLMLVRNLKHVHNRPLLVQLLDGSTTIDQLLDLSVDELANPAERKRQEELIAKERKRAEANQSLESIVENRRRAAANAAEETWRDTALAATGTVRESSSNKDLSKMTSIGPSGKVVINKKVSVATEADGPSDVPLATTKVAPMERMTAAERAAAENNTVTLDASTFAPFKPTGDAMEVESAQAAGNGNLIYKFDSMRDEDVAPSMLRIPVNLLSNVGTTRFTFNLTHTPKGTNAQLKRLCLTGQCIISDRRLQGLIPTVVECAGRIPTAEVNRTCAVAIERKLRVVGIFQFIIDKECAADYALYNSLYGQINDRVLATENDKFIPGCSVTLIPQTLMGKITILRTFLKEQVHGGPYASNSVDNDKILLYGVITTKKWGLAAHVKALAPETVPFIRQMEISTTNRPLQSGGNNSMGSGSSSFLTGLYK